MLANDGFEKGLLSTTQNLGIISILPKEDKCREYLKKLETNIILKCIL